MEHHITHSARETMELGKKFGEGLNSNAIVCFFGDLAAGKTTFIKGLVTGATAIDWSEVHSPTFTYLHIYSGIKTVYHFDLYRLKDAEEFLSMGFDEYFEAGGICCLEWSERIEGLLPEGCIEVHLYHCEGDTRKIEWFVK